MEYFATGMRFQPSEEERIAYLLYKVNGKPLPRNNFIFISTVDLYGDKEPWEICQDSGNHENYFFTRLKKIDDGPKCCRDIGRGRWESRSPRLGILDSRKQVIGFVKSYSYKSEKNADQDGKWILKQYTLADKFKCCIKYEYNDYTFCSVTRSPERYVSGQEKGSLDVESFFDQMLKENSIASSSSSSANNPPQISAVPKKHESVILQSNDLPDSSPSLDLDLSLKK